jgi:hypothetical protein
MVTEVTVFQTITRSGKYLLDITKEDIKKWIVKNDMYLDPEDKWFDYIEDYVGDVFHDNQDPSDGIPLHKRKFSEKPEDGKPEWDDYVVEVLGEKEGETAKHRAKLYQTGTNV